MDVTIPPEILEPGVEGVISIWLFNTGETVSEGDVLAEVMNAKAALPLEAPRSGRLTTLVAVEVPVRCGETVARID